MPLTADRAKPAVPFGGGYRLIDFALSNLVNSGLRQIVVLTQYKSHSLDRHVSTDLAPLGACSASTSPRCPRSSGSGKRWFSGSADAILQSLNLLRDEKPDIVVVVGADHVYRMDFSQMIDAHIASGHGRDRRRDPAADRAGRPVRRHRARPEESREDRGLPREAEGCRRAGRLPRRGARLDGQLRLRRRRSDRRRAARRRPRRLQPRHGRRHRPRLRGARRGRRLRPQPQRGPGRRPSATGSTGATWERSTRSSTPTRT